MPEDTQSPQSQLTPEQQLFILLAGLTWSQTNIFADSNVCPLEVCPASIEVSSEDLSYVVHNFEFSISKDPGEPSYKLHLTPINGAMPRAKWDVLVANARLNELPARSQKVN